jgi:hypothetical protein
VEHYNRECLHRGLELATPELRASPGGRTARNICRRGRFGDLIHEYSVMAA